MYKVVIPARFQKHLSKLDSRLQDRVKKIVKKLEKDLIGEPLGYELRNYYSVHFEHNRYRLIYYKEDDKIEILAVHVGKRTDSFYEELKKGIKSYLQSQ